MGDLLMFNSMSLIWIVGASELPWLSFLVVI